MICLCNNVGEKIRRQVFSNRRYRAKNTQCEAGVKLDYCLFQQGKIGFDVL